MPQLFTRKILAVGGSSVVPLPKGWLRYHKLDDGDEVDIVTNGDITIRPIRKDNKSKIDKKRSIKTGKKK